MCERACRTERQERERMDEERRRLEEMSEDEYDALSEQQKADVDRHRLEIKKQRLQRSVLCFVFVKEGSQHRN